MILILFLYVSVILRTYADISIVGKFDNIWNTNFYIEKYQPAFSCFYAKSMNTGTNHLA
jgi:hypothetical protein